VSSGERQCQFYRHTRIMRAHRHEPAACHSRLNQHSGAVFICLDESKFETFSILSQFRIPSTEVAHPARDIAIEQRRARKYLRGAPHSDRYAACERSRVLGTAYCRSPRVSLDAICRAPGGVRSRISGRLSGVDKSKSSKIDTDTGLSFLAKCHPHVQ